MLNKREKRSTKNKQKTRINVTIAESIHSTPCFHKWWNGTKLCQSQQKMG